MQTFETSLHLAKRRIILLIDDEADSASIGYPAINAHPT